MRIAEDTVEGAITAGLVKDGIARELSIWYSDDVAHTGQSCSTCRERESSEHIFCLWPHIPRHYSNVHCIRQDDQIRDEHEYACFALRGFLQHNSGSKRKTEEDSEEDVNSLLRRTRLTVRSFCNVTESVILSDRYRGVTVRS
jgi:hypothetical protein